MESTTDSSIQNAIHSGGGLAYLHTLLLYFLHVPQSYGIIQTIIDAMRDFLEVLHTHGINVTVGFI